jgi:hypothetical protein
VLGLNSISLLVEQLKPLHALIGPTCHAASHPASGGGLRDRLAFRRGSNKGAAASSSLRGTLITFDTETSILQNVAKANLAAHDFHFV